MAARFQEYQIIGRHLPSEAKPDPKIYRMRIFAPNEVVAKSRFWYFLGKLRKIKKANAPPKELENNGLVSFVEHVLFPASLLLDGERSFKVDREGAEPLVYKGIESLKQDYVADVVCALNCVK